MACFINFIGNFLSLAKIFDVYDPASTMNQKLNNIQNVQVCDATKPHASSIVRSQKNRL